jgi:hypothetical protein
MKKYSTALILLFVGLSSAQSQMINPSLLKNTWSANWITTPDAPAKTYGVYYFRKKIWLTEKPDSFIVHVSADNRYVLIINEKFVSLGPARNDLSHWNFETIDIAPYLINGDNIIAATVWNEGEYRPEGSDIKPNRFFNAGQYKQRRSY